MIKPHAFVAMPFGIKPSPEGVPIDFDRVYAELIRPALEDAGCEVFRADEEQRAGDIRTDMFQELLVADLVLADLTLDNPNVWYELGVRHALRARGVVLVQGPRATQPFDIYTDRKLRYRIAAGAPDPAFLAADRAALATMARATLDAPAARVVSPVYALLEHLREPAWRELLLAQRNEFSAAYEAWKSRLEIARQKNRVGDILVLADETPTRALWLEARRAAGNCLVKLRHFDFALEQFDAVLAADPDDKPSREKNAVCLGRLGRYEEAREWTRRLTEDHPRDAEVWALAGRVEKDNWVQRWCISGGAPAQLRSAAADELASLEEAITPYHRAFVLDPSHFYSGINSLTLHLLLRHLGGTPSATVIDNLIGGVLWASLTAQERDRKDYWARASYAELCLLVNPMEAVVREYRATVAAADRDWFALDSTRQTLVLLRHLGGTPSATVIDNLIGGVLWASLTAQERDRKDYWARASYAELCLLVNPMEAVVREYRATVAAADRDWFALDSTRQTLVLLRDLEFRPAETGAALAIVDAEIARAVSPFAPRRVILFSGHMMDAPGRDPPRLPADKEAAAAQRIAQALEDLGAGDADLALSQAAAGGDLLFLEACQARGVRCRVMLPLSEPEFIEQSILPSTNGEAWRARYFAVKAKLGELPRSMPAELGPLPKDVDPFERCNLWLLYTALGWGTDKVDFVCLWNGGGGDGPGGTKHMHEEVKRRTGSVKWIDTRKL